MVCFSAVGTSHVFMHYLITMPGCCRGSWSSFVVSTEQLACRRPELWHMSHSLERAVSNRGRQCSELIRHVVLVARQPVGSKFGFQGMSGSYAHIHQYLGPGLGLVLYHTLHCL